jgi:succinoglycan biosynthesis protein ExoO
MTERHTEGMSEIDVSVIVANYNGERFIADAIRSACNQSLRAIEVLVIDDASTDSSVRIIGCLAAEDSRIRLIESSVNGGAAAARNRALDVARGQWIGILDGDDLMHPDRLLRLIEEGVRSNADIVADDLLLFDTDRRAAPQALFAGRWSKAPLWVSAEDYLATNNFYGNGPALGYLKPIFRSSIIGKHNIRYDERLTIAEDYNFVFRLLMAGAKFRTIPQIGYFYRRHSGSISHRLNPIALKSILDVEKDWAERWPQASLRPLFRLRERSIRRAIAFDALVQAIKSRLIAKAVMTAIADPRAAWLLRLPIMQFIRRLHSDPKPSKSDRRQICILTRQRVIDKTNSRWRYLLHLAGFLAGRGFDIHLVIVSPTAMESRPLPNFSQDMAIFKSIKFQGKARLGRRAVAPELRIASKRWVGLLDRFLGRQGLISLPLSKSSHANGRGLTRRDQLFIARVAPTIADILIADCCFLTDAYSFALRPDARRIVIMHDIVSSRSTQLDALNTADFVDSVPLSEEIKMLAQADTIVAMHRDEATVLRRELPNHEVVVAPIAAPFVSGPQIGTAEIVLFVGSSATTNIEGISWFIEFCWPIVRARRPNAMLYVVGSVCNALVGAPATRLLNVADDLDKLYAEASVVISPLRAGAEVEIKLIEGLSRGKAMVVTSKTIHGVSDALSGCALVGDDASVFSTMVIDLLGDESKRADLGAKAISLISQHFSSESASGAISSVVKRTGDAAIRKSRAS